MSIAPVARRYARALLEIGVEQDNYDELREQLNALAELFAKNRQFQVAMLNPSIKLEERKAVMRKIAESMGLDDMLRNFTLLLLDNERFRFIEDIAQVYQELADARAGRVRAHVVSAVELEPAQRERIQSQLLELVEANSIELEASVDPELIGGVVARVGGLVLDGSVRHQLKTMRESLLQG